MLYGTLDYDHDHDQIRTQQHRRPLVHGVGDNGNMNSEVDDSQYDADDEAEEDRGDNDEDETDDETDNGVNGRTMQTEGSRLREQEYESEPLQGWEIEMLENWPTDDEADGSWYDGEESYTDEESFYEP